MQIVNFNLDTTVNYHDLQDQAMSALSEGLLDHVACTATRRAPLEDCLNLSMFIREPARCSCLIRWPIAITC